MLLGRIGDERPNVASHRFRPRDLRSAGITATPPFAANVEGESANMGPASEKSGQFWRDGARLSICRLLGLSGYAKLLSTLAASISFAAGCRITRIAAPSHSISPRSAKAFSHPVIGSTPQRS